MVKTDAYGESFRFQTLKTLGNQEASAHLTKAGVDGERLNGEAGTGGMADSRFSRLLGGVLAVRNMFFLLRVNRWAGRARIGNFLALRR